MCIRNQGERNMSEEDEYEARKSRLAHAITEALPAPEGIRDAWSRMIIETVLPEGVWSRPGLNQRDRSLITIAALTALYRPNELRLHIGRGLDNGLTEDEISEVIMHMAVYGGFPVAVEGMHIAREQFEQQQPEEESSS